jgi:hypothetical protein
MAKDKKQIKEKPLEKMTATELREVAKEIPGITGAHGMNKSELIAEIKQAKGIEDTGAKKRADAATIRQIKAKITALKAQRIEVKAQNDKKRADILRKKINRLKKQTRKAG